MSKKFLLIYRSPAAADSKPPSPAEMQQMLASWGAWKAKFSAEVVDLGDGLHPTGKVLTSAGVTDGPLVESQRVLYLLFNEGYQAARGTDVIRTELCAEAIRLTELLASHPVSATPETYALLALMYFHAARLQARIDELGDLVLLADQDRSRWNGALIHEGLAWFGRAAAGDRLLRSGIGQRPDRCRATPAEAQARSRCLHPRSARCRFSVTTMRRCSSCA